MDFKKQHWIGGFLIGVIVIGGGIFIEKQLEPLTYPARSISIGYKDLQDPSIIYWEQVLTNKNAPERVSAIEDILFKAQEGEMQTLEFEEVDVELSIYNPRRGETLYSVNIWFEGDETFIAPREGGKFKYLDAIDTQELQNLIGYGAYLNEYERLSQSSS